VSETMSDMMQMMMKECCGEDGMPDFEKMKGFMQKCGKAEFTEDEMKIMRQFCSQRDMPNAEKMKQFIQKFGC
jgi:hypothetical protein